MKTDLFDYVLPPELIAQVPCESRSKSRLLVYQKNIQEIQHKSFEDIVDYFEEGDLLILNSSKVIPARLYTVPETVDGRGSEILFIKSLNEQTFEAMVKPGKKFKLGRVHALPGGARVEVVGINSETGLRTLKMLGDTEALEVFRKYGEMPLPPYITSRESTPDRYQTVYSNVEGSVAAPTAGLHFDDEIFKKLRAKGVHIAEVILHVGLGTFKPVEAEDLEDHIMHEEVFYVSEETAEKYKRAKKAGKSIWACGTTSVRTLESAVISQGAELKTGWQATTCFIKPGYSFQGVDKFITNFHLPKSTLIVLVSAFVGREETLKIYAEAIEKRYRFYSFGDSMVML